MLDARQGTPAKTGSILGMPRNVALRIFSTLIILPPVVLILVNGGMVLTVFLALVAAGMAWEAVTILSGGEQPGSARLAALANAVIVLASLVGDPAVLAGVVGVCLAVLVLNVAVRRVSGGPWLVVGGLIMLLPCFAFIWLRNIEPDGLVLVAWLVAAVVATDIGAYLAGRSIGGPKLAPRISPNKTWSGLFGGMIASGAVGVAVATQISGTTPLVLGAASAGLAIVAQAGDLGESAFKRKHGVKDSSALIPGHGGVLDRLDGHMAVITFTALMVMISGQTPLMW